MPGLGGWGLLARLVLGQQGLGTVDVALLAAFGATAEQHDQGGAFLEQIDPVARAPIDDVFAQAAKPLDAGQIARDSRSLAVVTLAAACASRLSNHRL